MENFYSAERNVQIVIALLKAHGIKKVIVSPGSTNVPFVGSIQNDPFFEIYSSVDERSAAYIACGMAAESDEPVALSCTGATASRNYMPGLTEAYYRKLPVLAITSSQVSSLVGHLVTQVTDRSQLPNDIAVYQVLAQSIKDDRDVWDCEMKVNAALIALKKKGGGPVHINLETVYSNNFSIKDLPPVRVVEHTTIYDSFPDLPIGNIGIFVGSHRNWTMELTNAIDDFCSLNNGVVFYDHTSGYHGKYGVLACMLGSQDCYKSAARFMRLMIHIGEMSGAYAAKPILNTANEIWRVNEDGVVRDTFGNLVRVFEMQELDFFKYYNEHSSNATLNMEYFKLCRDEYMKLYNHVPLDLPFSNLWVAHQLAPRLPKNSVLHLGIMNTLRCWNFFEIPASVHSYCNVGGFGIDGIISSLVGASLCNKDKLYFGVLGDLACFYDINVLGNRHVGNNVRIILINNGHGQEFRNYFCNAAKWGDEAEAYMAAGGHFGKQSPTLIRHFVENLGYEYLTASSKDDFNSVVERFLAEEKAHKPILFEVFTRAEDENAAIYAMRNMEKSANMVLKRTVRNVVSDVLGVRVVDGIKKFLKK